MKNKKFLVISLLIIIIIAIISGICIARVKVGDFLFSTDGTVNENVIIQEEKNNLY